MLRCWALVFPHYQLPITNYQLPITHYLLPITHYLYLASTFHTPMNKFLG
ncbi:hypothetical protein [Fischerella thermalis]